MSGGTLRDRLNGFLGSSPDDSAGGNSAGGTLRSRLDAFRQPQQEPLDLDTEAEAAEQRASTQNGAMTLEKSPEAPPSSWLDKGRDALTAFGEGAFKGVGLDPAQIFGDRTGQEIQTAHSANPYTAGAAKFGGEMTTQALAGVGPVVGGVLSGIGNTAGSLADKARGAIVGGVTGKVAGAFTGKLSSMLGRGADAADRAVVDQGLMHSGADESALQHFDELGGRDKFYEGARRLGLTGKPGSVAAAAPEAFNASNAERQALESQVGADSLRVDPAAVRSGIEGAAQRIAPGITPVEGAADRAAGYVDNLQQPGQQGVPWNALNKQRSYWGEKANFASGTPENTLKQGVHGTVNHELADAMSLQQPGAGDLWLGHGQDMNVASEMGDMANKALKRPAPALSKGDLLAAAVGGGLGSAAGLGTGTTVGALGGLAAKSAYNANEHLINQGAAKLGSLAMRGGEAAAPAMAGPAAGDFGGRAAKQQDPTQTALNMLYSPSRGAELGQFKAQFAQAAGSPDTTAVQSLVNRLTFEDADFRTKILPLLSGRGM